MTFKIGVSVGVGLFSLLAWAGLSATDLSEYATVGQKRAAEAANGAIPNDWKIDRLKVIQQKLDQELSQQKFLVAKEQVALEDAEAALTKVRDGGERSLAAMKEYRGLLGTGCQSVKVGCHTVSSQEIRRALARHLADYEAQQEKITAYEQVVARRHQAYQFQATRYAEWNQQKTLLAHKIESLEARNTVLSMSDGQEGAVASELARALQLADEIDVKLRIAEKQQALGTEPLNPLLNTTAIEDDTEARVDKLLATQSLAD